MRASLVKLSVGTLWLVLLTGCGSKPDQTAATGASSPSLATSAGDTATTTTAGTSTTPATDSPTPTSPDATTPDSSTSPGSDTSGSTDASPESAASGSKWKDYFVAREGRTCTSSAKLPTGRSTQTRTINDVRKDASGVSFSIDVKTKAVGGAANKAPVQRLSLPYVLGNDGTLKSKPSLQEQGPFKYKITGFEAYPSIPDLRAGKVARSTIKVRLEATTASARKALQAGLKPGETAPEMSMKFAIGPAPTRPRIITKAGKFTDIVGVEITAESIKYDNLTAAASKAAQPSIDALKAQFKTTAYYARKVGIVQTTVAGTLVKLVRCTG